MEPGYIAFFDSGIGGLTLLKECAQQLAGESFLYFGDNANAPYGNKSPEEIERLTLTAFGYLSRFPLKAAVLACNTVTAECAAALRALSLSRFGRGARAQTRGKGVQERVGTRHPRHAFEQKVPRARRKRFRRLPLYLLLPAGSGGRDRKQHFRSFEGRSFPPSAGRGTAFRRRSARLHALYFSERADCSAP